MKESSGGYNRAPKYIKQILTDLKREIDRDISNKGDFTALLQKMDR